MSRQMNKTTVQICIDHARSVGDVSDGKYALLYDEAQGCYYKVSLSHIVGAAIKSARELEAKNQKEFSAFKDEAMREIESIRAEQRKFMSDMKKTNQILIDLVEKGAKK